ncbi:MAG: phytanoyl-CoA dioxygenase family protein [Myxococcota bacterium]|nr:phytanoyl-CoA dioxygenase family protein [Myxococcota bacterium]
MSRGSVDPDVGVSLCRADPDSGLLMRVLDAQQIRSWREQGFVVVDDLFAADLLERTIADADEVFPAGGSPEAEAWNDFGSSHQMEFPADSAGLNEMTLHPRLLTAVTELLRVGVRELRLTQSEVWPKYGRAGRSGAERDNDDQRIHVDYPNHTLVHPPPWDSPEAVEIFVYLSEFEQSGGATAVVPRTGPDDPAYAWPIVGTPGVGALPWLNDRISAEAYLEREAPDIAGWRATHLYPREVPVHFGVGTVLFYRHDTWHRGTPLRPGTRRLAQNLTFRKAGSEWVSTRQPGWARAMYRRSQVMEHLVARASVDQRCVLGFPAPGHAYWTPETLAAVDARYGPLGMDAAPYVNALRSG